MPDRRWSASLEVAIQLTVATVSFSGGAGKAATIVSASLKDAGGREVLRFSSGQGPLVEALAAPIFGRYASFRGHPRILATVVWDLASGEVGCAGTRGGRQFSELLDHRPRSYVRQPRARDMSRDVSSAVLRRPPLAEPRTCPVCGTALDGGKRVETVYCCKRCRQAASRARIRASSARASLRGPSRCALCVGPMPVGVRAEALYCSKRCRQAASRRRLRGRRGGSELLG